jgi:hypothetical protein
MEIASYSRDLQFSNVPTRLNHLIESVVDGLGEIAIGIADIGQSAIDLMAEGYPSVRSVSSRLSFQASKASQLLITIKRVKDEMANVKVEVNKKCLMKLSLYTASRLNINNASNYIENSIKVAASVINEGPTYKQAYYEMTKIIIEYVSLVKEFNNIIGSYRKIHNITDANFMDADTSLSFFRLRAGILNFSPTPEHLESSESSASTEST